MTKAIYHSPEFPEGISRTAFRRLRREQKLEVMREWFGQHYEDPVHRTPYQTAEGGYQWIHGGPYYAQEELMGEFEGLASEKMINDLVEEIEHECTEWTSAPDRADYYDEGYVPVGIDDIVDGDGEWPPVVVVPRPEVDPLDAIANKISFGLVPRFGSPEEQAARDAVLAGITKVEDELDRLDKPSSMIGHNHPPEPIEATVVTEDDEKQKIKATAVELRSEIKADAPNVAEVITRTRRLRDSLVTILKWTGKKIDTGIDEFIKSAMKTLGISAAPFILAKATGYYDALIGVIGSLYLNVTHWLQMVMSVPF